MKRWLKSPDLRIGEGREEERHATWLEAFFDLIFVAVISELAHNLNQDVSLSGFLVRAAYRFSAACVILALAIAGTGLSPVELIGLVTAVCAVQIILDLRQAFAFS